MTTASEAQAGGGGGGLAPRNTWLLISGTGPTLGVKLTVKHIFLNKRKKMRRTEKEP